MNLIKGANMDNKTTIQNMINDRVSNNETTICLFQILLLNKSVKEELIRKPFIKKRMLYRNS